MKRVLFGLLSLLWLAAPAHGFSVWQVLLADTVTLTSNGTNDTAFGLPDGTGCDILWDHNRNGRDDTLGHFEDSLALECRNAPSCPNGTGQDTLNFNSFALNGEAQQVGRGTFYSEQYLRANGPAADPQWLPRPDSFYVRVCGDSVYWESEIFSPPAQTTPQTIYLHNWRCVHRPCDVTPTGIVRGFRASDTTFCDGIHLRWDPYPAYGDSIFLYRRDTLIARVSARDTSYIDTAAPVGVTVRYAAVARRGSYPHHISPPVWETGFRWAPPPPVTQVTATYDSAGHIQICWYHPSNLAVDFFIFFRNGDEIGRVIPGTPGTQCWTYLVQDPTREEYCVLSWNHLCGYSNATEPGHCTAGPPPPTMIMVQYGPTDGHALGAPCDTATAILFADGTPIWVCWDNNANGMDTADVTVAAFAFNGTAYGMGAGYFGFVFHIQNIPTFPDTALYYVKVNSAGVCWTTDDFLPMAGDPPPPMSLAWSQWTCADHPCGPPGTAQNVNATDGNCYTTTVTWEPAPQAQGYHIWRTGEQSATPALFAATIMAPAVQYFYGAGNCREHYRFYVTAFNAVGAADDSLYDVGFRVTVPDAPTTTYATNGLYDDHVRIDWPAVGGSCPAMSFVIWRSGIAIDSVPSTSLTYDDTTAVPGVHYAYSVHAVNQCGASPPSPIDSGYRRGPDYVVEKPLLPTRTALFPSYPNPFNARTTIAFDLAQTGVVSVVVYDLMGREVAVLTQGAKGPGHYVAAFDGSHLPTGVYICRMEIGSFVGRQKLLLLK